jgi:DNA-binding transcriptional LysR family regulator
MELHHLRYFAAVARTGSFASASKELSIAASPLSRRVKDLERYMGTPLLRRSDGRLELTAAGARLFPLAHQMLGLADEVERQRVRTREGPLRVGLVPGMPPRVSIALGEVFDPSRSSRDLSLHPHSSVEQTQLLLEGFLDLAIVRVHSDSPQLQSMALVDEEFVVVASRGYGEDLPDPLPPRALAGWSLVTAYPTSFSDPIDRLMRDQKPSVLFIPGADIRVLLTVIQRTRGFVLGLKDSEDFASDHFITRHARWPITATTYLQWRADRADLADVIDAMRVAMRC